ncbi:ankyrin repeat domain-containing protein SOWAHA-like isoform X2 [Ambystoma mexicanum]|uniref:ankyrin repeat domain-containing protein SOWAHA-like isoform X2 n=1 Tax=Ambystoma mexicanum TaxID=8296 RepID=UPI0037E91B19
MMEALSEEELLQFLCEEGGKAKNSELLTRYQTLINHLDPQLRANHRQTFKEIINKVAVVKQEDGEKYVILKKRYQPLIAGIANPEASLPPTQTSMGSEGQQSHAGLAQWEGSSSASPPSVTVLSPPPERASTKEKQLSVVPRINVKDFSSLIQTHLSTQRTGLHSVGLPHHVERPSSSPSSPKGPRAKCHSAKLQEEDEADGIPRDSDQDVFEDGGSSMGSASVALDPVEKEWLQGAASGNSPALSELLKQEPALAWKKASCACVLFDCGHP